MNRLALVALISLMPLAAGAHGGRTDRSGCHKERASAVRHCHGAPGPRAAAAKAPVAPRPVEAVNVLEIQPDPVLSPQARARREAYSSEKYPTNPYLPDPEGAKIIIVDPPAVPVVVAPARVTPAAVVRVAPVAPRAVPAKPKVKAKPKPQEEHVFYFDNCSQAQSVGKTPLRRGDDGYRAELDENGDGIACE